MKLFPKKLLNGYQNFMVNRFSFEKKRHEALAKNGQKPEIMVISCCDSRATPENIFDTNPGEIFVLRNIANLVPPFQEANPFLCATSSAIEYAVLKLNVKHIVILGHAHCGGIQAILDKDAAPLSNSNFTGKWMRGTHHIANEIIEDQFLTFEQKETKLEQTSIQASLKNLRNFPWIKEREKKQEIFLSGAWFGIATGELWILNETEKKFLKVNYNKDEPFCHLNSR